ncbi:MAG: excalibur calcium-binding domain-containing protein [Sphingomonas sp.]|nr:excalibur calcium-binding domain-containing protein [Sphingomonas sp.]
MGNSRALSATSILIGGAALGAVVGIGSLAATPQGRSAVAARGTDIAIATGIKRAREPQAGDHWPGCNAARAAGTAPIYRGEPGYRPGMDGDDDGIACEPHR